MPKPMTRVQDRKCQTPPTGESRGQEMWHRRPANQSWRSESVDLFSCDAVDLLKAMQNEVVDLVFLDPPFNLGKRYGSRVASKDRKPPEDYQRYLATAVSESSRVLKPGGALYLYHIPEWAIRLAPVLSEQLSFRHWIAIAMKNSFARGDKLYPAHYALLYFTKGLPAIFRRPKIAPVRCRHCNQLVKDYGGYRKYVRDGVNLSDIWDDVSPVRHRTRKYRDANEIPMLIVERVLAISGVKDGIFVDPFMGAGTAIVAALTTGMRIIGSDIEESQVNIVVSRIKETIGNE